MSRKETGTWVQSGNNTAHCNLPYSGSQMLLIPIERPINKADKSGAAQIELGESLEPPAAQLKDTQKPAGGLVKSLRLWLEEVLSCR